MSYLLFLCSRLLISTRISYLDKGLKKSRSGQTLLAFSLLQVGVNIGAKLCLPRPITTTHAALQTKSQGEVEDPPWAAVQHRGRHLLEKMRMCTYHQLKRAQHNCDIKMMCNSGIK